MTDLDAPKIVAAVGLIGLAGFIISAIRDFRAGHVTERGRNLGNSEKIFRESNPRDFWAVTIFQSGVLTFLVVVFSLILLLS
jgi:hypothetical protein